MRIIALVLIIFCSVSLKAQDDFTICGDYSDTVISGSKVTYYPHLLDSLIKSRIEYNERFSTVEGYRVQVFFGSNRRDANELKSELLKKFPDEDVYVLYSSPYFKVRVGNYRTKIEALKVLNLLKEDENFSTILLVKDNIEYPKLPDIE